jgi:hypothetical protein
MGSKNKLWKVMKDTTETKKSVFILTVPRTTWASQEAWWQEGNESCGKVVPLLLRVQVVLGSNLGQETSYPDSGFSWFSSVPPNKCQDNTLN